VVIAPEIIWEGRGGKPRIISGFRDIWSEARVACGAVWLRAIRTVNQGNISAFNFSNYHVFARPVLL
jgi:hypothetical protein